MLTPNEIHVYVAGGLHLVQPPAMVALQRHFKFRGQLELLPPLTRSLVNAVLIGVMLYVVGTGVVAVCYPRELLTSPLGIALCGLQAIAWSVRVLQQFTIVRKHWPVNDRGAYRMLTTVYSLLAGLYLWFWWSGGVA